MDKAKKVLKSAGALAGIGAFTAVYIGLLDYQRVQPKAKGGQKRVACIGDSITYGALVGGRPWNSYPSVLGRMLGSGYCVDNFGYSDRTAIRDSNHPYSITKVYRDSLDFRPDIVLFMLGTNDSKPEIWDPEKYRRDVTEMIDSYLGLDTDPEVFIMLPPPAYPFLGKVRWSIRPEVIENEVIPICREIAEEKGLIVIDMHEVFTGKESLFVDGIHPGAEGARLMAEKISSIISR